jgi:hypothetical protein
VRAGHHVAPLRQFLTRATRDVRHVFAGPITYAALPFEPVGWDPSQVRRAADADASTVEPTRHGGRAVTTCDRIMRVLGMRARRARDPGRAAGRRHAGFFNDWRREQTRYGRAKEKS